LEHSEEGDSTKVVIPFFILFYCNVAKKVTTATLPSPSYFSFIATQQKR
jgi:hypothetical protein